MKLALVVIGYKRADSIKRLLESLDKANYCGDKVDLLISIDNSGTNFVEEASKEFNWKFGEKKIYTYPERQGLRKHILSCGRFLDEYDAIAVLEDDVTVSPAFYEFMREAVGFYKDDEKVAGISLYGYALNENNMLPFTPDYSEYDTFFIQFASSWGQIWMRDQWKDFYNWYQKNDEEFTGDGHIPKNVSSWPKTSWKKYHIKYCIEKNKYFAYPYMSMSTCFSDAGQHTVETTIKLQTQLIYTDKMKYSFAPENAENAVKYDAFFERVLPKGMICNDIKTEDVCLDLYGFRNEYLGKRYVISSKPLEYKSVSSFGAVIEPQERNIMQNISGRVFFLYDTYVKDNPPKLTGQVFMYRYRVFTNRKALINEWISEKKADLKRKLFK